MGDLNYKTTPISIRLSKDVEAWLRLKAESEAKSLSDVIRDALVMHAGAPVTPPSLKRIGRRRTHFRALNLRREQ